MTEHLSELQISRIEALRASRDVGRKSAGAFGAVTPPDITDLVDLAEYILNGTHPMERYDKEKEKS